MLKIAIIGGGISGLTAAYRLSQHGARPVVFEHSPRLGGAVRSFRQGGWLLEAGPDSLLRSKPAALDLARELGVELVESCSQGPPGIVRDGQVLPLPDGLRLMAPTQILPFLMSPVLSWVGKLRALCEGLVPRRIAIDDESVSHFVSRRFGLELMEVLAQPLIGGIYAADLSRLSLQATLPMFESMERQQGSVTAALLASIKTGATHPLPLFLSPRQGMESLTLALAEKISNEDLRRNQPVLRLTSRENRWEVETATKTELFDGVILACSSRIATRLLATIAPEACDYLSQTAYVSTATIHLKLDEAQIEKPMKGSGFVVPHLEGLDITACTFAHKKFPDRAPAGKALLRVHLGNAMNQNILKCDEFQVIKRAISQLRPLLGIRGEPEESFMARHTEVLPQYGVGHCHRMSRALKALESHRNLSLAGNGISGVGISDCIVAATTSVTSLLKGLS